MMFYGWVWGLFASFVFVRGNSGDSGVEFHLARGLVVRVTKRNDPVPRLAFDGYVCANVCVVSARYSSTCCSLGAREVSPMLYPAPAVAFFF